MAYYLWQVRVLAHNIISHALFDKGILFSIMFSSGLVVAADPFDEEARWIKVLDLMLIGVFVIEALLKILDMGLILGHGAYLREAWNVLDMGVIIVSILSIAFSEVRALRALRMFRALRPLRLISRNQGLRVAVSCIISSIRPCVSVTVLCLFVFSLFAIVGVELFKGKFHSCRTSLDWNAEP